MRIQSMQGFTLIELVLVILITSLIAVFVSLQWPANHVNIGAQAEQLANDIRYTQELAMTKGQRFYLIETSNTTYQIKNSAGTAALLALGKTTVTLNTGITFGTLTNLPNNLIAFNGDGTPYTTSTSPGTLLASAATIPLVSGSDTKTITISPETGRVTIS